jgi:hypothetical protein
MKMKKWSLLLCAFILFFVFACKKSGSPGNNPSSSSYLSSITSYSPQTRIVDSFTYDSTHRIARFAQYVYDSSQGSPSFYGFTVDFALPASGWQPSSYTYNSVPASGAPNLHQLSYDGQGRISKDTSVSGSHFVTYYSYANNNIASTVLFDGTRQNNQVDTLFMNNGNVGTEHVYYPNNNATADSLEGNLQFGYASTANPAYHAETTNSIGPLLFILNFDGYGNFADFISKNVLNKVSAAAGLPPGASINYNLINDSKGRLSQMTAFFGGASETIIYKYY